MNMAYGMIVRVFANRPGDLGSIPGRVIPKTPKMVLDASLLNTQQYKVGIKSKVERSRERSSALSYASVQQLSKGGPSGNPRLQSPTLLLLLLYKYVDVIYFDLHGCGNYTLIRATLKGGRTNDKVSLFFIIV